MPSFTRLCVAALFAPRAQALLFQDVTVERRPKAKKRAKLSASVHGDTVKEHHLSHAGPGLSSPEHIIDEYLAQHGADAFRRDFQANRTKICERHFVSQVCTAPPRFGNEMVEFVNAFAFALVANRTFVLTEDTCSNYLDFSGRILRGSEVQDLTRQAGCRIGQPKFLIKQGKPLSHLPFDNVAPGDWASEQHVFTRFWHQEVARRVLESKVLGAEATRRAQSLFGTNILLGYNALFHAAWAFKDSVRNHVEEMLRDQASVFKVGLHVRHSGLCRAGCQENRRAAQCVKRILNSSTSQNCVVLIATDHPEAEEDLAQQVKSNLFGGGRENKTLASVERLNFHQTAKDIEAATGCQVRSTLATEKVVQHDASEEHGPWAMFSSVADLYFLSRSDALVVGYFGAGNSSFSERATELFADGSASKALQVYDYSSNCGNR